MKPFCVQLPPDSDLDSVRRKVSYDLYYILNMTAWLELRVLAATALKLLGMSFPRLKATCGVPDAEAVVRSYECLCSGPAAS